MFIDARIPVRFAPAPGPDDAFLVEAAPLPPGAIGLRFDPPPASQPTAHPAGCACCTVRPAAAIALGTLFQMRARGETPFFRTVAASVADEAALRAALASDPVLQARFRPAD